MQGKVKERLGMLGGIKKKRVQRYSWREKERGNIEGRCVSVEGEGGLSPNEYLQYIQI